MHDTEKTRAYGKAAVPLYTSYPTETAFHPLSAAQHGAALREIHEASRVSVYLHVPYCRQICHYCACFTKMSERDDVIADYTRHLIKEIKLQAAYFAGRPKLSHLHWGGGTASIIGQEGFSRAMAALREAFSFESEAELAIELDPRRTDAALCRFLAAEGINRVSLGVQDLTPRVQAEINRIQTAEDMTRTVEALRAAGISGINFDLLFGLPRQTAESARQTCEDILRFKPSRISCFGYIHFPQQNANQKQLDAAALPDAAARLAQARAQEESLTKAGYIPIGLENFVLPDDSMAKAAQNRGIGRNFGGYTDDNAEILLGFGASAVSRLPDLYAQNVADIGQYKRAVDQGKLASFYGIFLSDEDKRRAAIINDLLCRFQTDLTPFGGASAFAREMELLKPFQDSGMVARQGNAIAITAAGRLFARLIAAQFDAYRQENIDKQHEEAAAPAGEHAPRRGIIPSGPAV